MAVQEQTPYIEYTANGVATSFALEFDCENKDHLIVTLDGVEPPLGEWSLISGAVVFIAAPASGSVVAIQRNTPFSRSTDYQSYNNSFRPGPVNDDLDAIWFKLQELGYADWLVNQKIAQEILDRIAADEQMLDYILNQDNALKADYIARNVALKQYIDQMIALVTGDPSFSGITTDFVFDTPSGKTQEQINDEQKAINRKSIGNYDPLISYVENSLVIKDGLLQKLTGGVWRPKDPTYYDFGAKIDGETDDTAAFIAYHTVFKSAKLPKGRMLLSSIDLDQFKASQTVGINIIGEGTEQSFFDFTGTPGFYSSSNTFFRDFGLKNLQVNRKAGDKVGIGVYIGSAGAEQVNFENVTYRGWLIGRAVHTWNSSMKGEVFRACKYPFSHYGTSTPVTNPYALACTSPYMLGYQSTIDGVLSIPSIPSAYSELDSFAADDCGLDGSIFKFGRVSGITGISLSCERPKGAHIFDFEDIVATRFSNVVFENFTIDVTTGDTALLGIIKKPATPFGNIIFNNIKVATAKVIYLVSGDGSGVQFINPQMNDSSTARISDAAALGLRVNQISYGQDTRQSGELGLSLAANGQTYQRVKNRKGIVLIDATTQKLVIYGGSLSEGLAQGLMTVANIMVNPISKSGNNTNEKAGQIYMSSAMDYNASNMAGHLKVDKSGTLTAATTVTRNTANTTHLQFDVVIEASVASTRHLLSIDLTYNGISNPNGIAWEIQSK